LVRNLISSLVTQFSRRCPSIPEALSTLFSNSLDGEHQPSNKSLTKVLRSVLGGFCHAYIVLDALDECAEQDKLISFMEEIASWDLSQIHILATSRPDPVFEDRLKSETIHLQSALMNADIQIHICERLQNDFRLSKWPLVVKKEIEARLMEGADGM
jgi:hypothetical protein